MRKRLLLCVMVTFVLMQCGGSDEGNGNGASGLSLLENACEKDCLHIQSHLQDGEWCSSIAGCGDCPNHAMASECINYCANNFCQTAPCSSDADCQKYGDFVCEAYVISDINYGNWCDENPCPKGTAGCECDNGSCNSYLTCGADNKCFDTCTPGCREGLVCCGGAFCGGDCIGTPCCDLP